MKSILFSSTHLFALESHMSNHLKSYLASLLTIVTVLSCNTPDLNNPQENLNVSGVITGEASHISCRNAVLSGKLNMPDPSPEDLVIGILYGPDNQLILGVADNAICDSYYENQPFTICTKTLEPETLYYYRCFVSSKHEDKTYYGDIKSFTTLPVSSMIKTNETSGISAYSATINATLNLTDCVYNVLIYGGQFTSQTGESIKVISKDLSGDSFSATATSLIRDTQYDAQAFVMLDGRTYTADIKSFNTKGINATVTLNDISNLTCSSVTISGKLNIESTDSFKTRATLYYSSTEKTIEGLRSSGISQYLSLASDGSFSLSLPKLSIATMYYFTVIATVDDVTIESPLKTFSTKDLPVGPVDMGLTVKWASFNIGASKPEEYGDYFSWGETYTKSTYLWRTYSLCKGHTDDMTKYCTSKSYGTVDNKTVLEWYDDVASQKLGGGWRMPTEAECADLMNAENCSSMWCKYNGVNGVLVTSKKTSNSIFLPAAGKRCDVELQYAGENGYYWSSSLSIEWPSAAVDVYLSDVSTGMFPSTESRFFGCSVRPVLVE